MGQTQSQTQTETDTSAINDTSKETPPNDPPSSSMESLIAEAAAYGDDENESIDAKARKALECPCIADLREGACGSQFSEAFLCFMKSTEEAKGSDCVHPFVALQSCIKANPDAFSKETMGDDKVKEEQESSAAKNRILPPKWALESPSLKPRL